MTLFLWWAGMDSNHRTRMRTDLQSAAFSHSATYPSKMLLFECLIIILFKNFFVNTFSKKLQCWVLLLLKRKNADITYKKWQYKEGLVKILLVLLNNL